MNTVTPDRKVVIVTGASRGLGREISLAFGQEGWRVAVCFHTGRSEAEEVVRLIAAGSGEAVSQEVDVREPAAVNSMVDDVLSRWGRLDVLINNAGIARDGLCIRMSEADWDDVISTNLSGPFYCIRAAARAMMRQRAGHIINVASIVGVQGREGQANYAASKAGLIGLTKGAAKELGRSGIQVNAVLPGYLRTELGKSVADSVRDRILAEQALERFVDAPSVAGFIVTLTGLSSVSGQVFNLDSRML